MSTDTALVKPLRMSLVATVTALALLAAPGMANAQEASQASTGALGSGSVEASASANALATEVFDLTNDDRNKHDRRALKLDAKVSEYAERHSRKMAEAGKLWHTRKLARPLRSVNWRYAGENVGVCYVASDQDSCLEDLQKAFMASPGHRRNILEKKFDKAATGVYQQGSKIWVTVIFYG